MPSIQTILTSLPGENTNNVKIEYYRAVKFIQGLPAYWAEAGVTEPESAEAGVTEPKASETTKRTRKSA